MSKHLILAGALIMMLGVFMFRLLVVSRSPEVAPATSLVAKQAGSDASLPEPAHKNPIESRDNENAGRTKARTNPVGFAALSEKERTRQITAVVDATYQKVIAGLRISPGEREKLRNLLIERSLARWAAHDLATADAVPQQDALNRFLELADKLSDEEIATAVGPTLLKKIQAMLVARPYITRINQHYDPAMAQAGVPLLPEQVLPLAEVFYHTFGSTNNPQIEANRRQVDPVTGLTPLDLVALERAKAVLTRPQLEIVRQKIAALNRAHSLGKS